MLTTEGVTESIFLTFEKNAFLVIFYFCGSFSQFLLYHISYLFKCKKSTGFVNVKCIMRFKLRKILFLPF